MSATDDCTERWSDVLDAFDRATRLGEDFAPPAIDGPDGLGPLPESLRPRAEQLLAECAARAESVRDEMVELDAELVTLRRRTAPRAAWTDDAQGVTPAVGHLV